MESRGNDDNVNKEMINTMRMDNARKTKEKIEWWKNKGCHENRYYSVMLIYQPIEVLYLHW